MELTRRDALAALSTAGVAVGGGALVWERLDDGSASTDAATPGATGESRTAGGSMSVGEPVTTGETLTALATVVFPSSVSGVEEFVETYVVGRAADRPSYAHGVAETTDLVEARAGEWFGDATPALPRADRDALLRQLGVETAEPDPEGSDAGRVRYYVVNELLYALYSSPTGGKLVGIENPQGHPGGIESYQRGPGE